MWKEAQFNNISWSTALKTGIKVMLGSNDDTEEIKKKMKGIMLEYKFYEEKLTEKNNTSKTEKQKQGKEKQLANDRKKFIKENKNIFEYANNKCKTISGPDISDVYEFWVMINKKHTQRFGSSFGQDEFMDILEERK